MRWVWNDEGVDGFRNFEYGFVDVSMGAVRVVKMDDDVVYMMATMLDDAW